MGSTDSLQHYGGADELALTADATVGWTDFTRWMRIQPSNNGYTVTLKAANSPEIPYGMMVWFIVNDAALAQSFTLEDAEGEFSELIASGDAAIIGKYQNSSGQDRFSIDLREGL